MTLTAMSTEPEPSYLGHGASSYGPYFLCGWRLASAIPLPELSPWPAGNDSEADTIELQIAPVDGAGGGSLFSGHGHFSYGVESSGDCVWHLPGLVSYRVSSDASLVTLDPAPGADPKLLRAHFYGSILAILCFIRGLLPLHGACVRLDNAAVIFTGPGGAGKSTLAAAFAQQGYSVLCDDVCAIQLLPRKLPLVWPALPRLKLLPDAIETFALDRDTVYTPAAHGQKGHFVAAQEGLPEALVRQPLAAIYLLSGQEAERVAIRRLQGASAFLPLRSQVHRSNMGAAMGLRERIFHDLATLVGSVPVFELSRSKSLRCIDEMVQAVERHVNATQPQGDVE